MLSEVMRTYPKKSKQRVQQTLIAPEGGEGHLTTEETIRYQRREIGKELLLLEKHLQQGCKIDAKPCDCCLKHPTAIEALAQEALGMASDPVFDEVIEWTREISPMTTEAASASGKYDRNYPKLAIKARELRKAVMGTESAGALLAKEGEDANVSTTEEQEA